MTISTTTIKNSYSGNGSTTAFAYTFKLSDEDEIQVMLYNCGSETQYLFKGERIAQVIPTNYIKGIFPVKSNRRKGGFGSSDDYSGIVRNR